MIRCGMNLLQTASNALLRDAYDVRHDHNHYAENAGTCLVPGELQKDTWYTSSRYRCDVEQFQLSYRGVIDGLDLLHRR